MILKFRVSSMEARGFFDGSQGIGPDGVAAELEAQFRQLQERVHQESAVQAKGLEAQVATLSERRADAEKNWRLLWDKTGVMPPPVALPLAAVLAAAFAVVGETSLLAPVMDGFGIAEPFWQRLTALVIVVTSSGLLELTVRSLRRGVEGEGQTGTRAGDELPGIWVRLREGALVTLLTTVSFTLLVVLGWWRAEEMIFGAGVEQGDWGAFLSQNALLTRLCVTLLSVGLPVFAAAVFEWSFDRLRLATEWRKARREALTFSAQHNKACKALETEAERRDRQIAILDERRKEWYSAYAQGREMGAVIGARRLPLLQVVVRVSAVVVTMLAVCTLSDTALSGYMESLPARCLLYACVTLALGCVYGYRAVRHWDRPTVQQLYDQRAVIWRQDSASAPAAAAERTEGRLKGIQVSTVVTHAPSNGNKARIGA